MAWVMASKMGVIVRIFGVAMDLGQWKALNRQQAKLPRIVRMELRNRALHAFALFDLVAKAHAVDALWHKSA
jgi:hypothetical protein